MRSGPFVRRSADATNDGRRHARRGRLSRLLWAVALAASGCKSHHAERDAFAPPYAPPVYPQPQVQIPGQPNAYAAAGGAATVVPAGAIPAGSLPPGAVVVGAPTAATGMVVPAGGGDCPPCSADGMVVGGSAMPVTMIDGSAQTPPCPPGP